MALKDRILADIQRVYMNFEHFAETHTWNGRRFPCVVDEETALKRKNNNVVDLSWDNNTTETLIYTPVDGFPGRALPNEHIIFDTRPMKVLQVQNDMGMYTILLMAQEPKAVAQ
jgi:hypothetical protein